MHGGQEEEDPLLADEVKGGRRETRDMVLVASDLLTSGKGAHL